MVYREILAGSLRLTAEKLLEMSRTNPEPNGLQAHAQAAKAKSLLDWSQTEMTAAQSKRDFDVEKISREEIAWAIRFAEEEAERLGARFIELHEQEHGPIGDWTSALEREPGNFEMTPEMEKVHKRRYEYEGALFELNSVLRKL